ncbi:MAG: hypothetical protein COB17_07895 [Sulfurimonas sp.]|nr:MAG: hypothetical protein COB17_07895 [Sulfurimonas sp.]
MDLGINTFQNIGTNYSIKLNKDETLVYEDDTLRESKKSEYEKSDSTNELSDEEKIISLKLQARDAEVRAHEAAHQSAGASTGAASFTYERGPDGRMYAIGGEVSISIKSGSTPQETINNAQAVIASAMAPASPSGQDQSVASSAKMMILKAQQQISKEAQEKIIGKEVYKNEEKNNSNSLNQSKTPKLDQIDTSA